MFWLLFFFLKVNPFAKYQYVGEFNFKNSPSHFVGKYNAVHKLILDTTYSTVSH